MTSVSEGKVPIKEGEEGVKKFMDQRELTIRYEIPMGDIYQFFDSLREGKITVPKCVKCQKLFFPPQSVCPTCKSDDMEWITLSGEAELLASTKIYVKPLSFEKESPYVVAVGRLKEGVNVLAWLLTENYENAKVGAKMKLIVTENKEGNAIYSYRLA